MHNSWDYGEGVKKVKIGLGARVDGYDKTNKITYELKPDNPKAIKRGNKQLERYLEVLNKEGWTGILVLYD